MESIVQRKARERGIRVMLSGWGGDEAVSYNGVGISAEHFLRGQWLQLANDLRLKEALRNPRLFRWSIERFLATVLVPLVPERLFTSISRRKAASYSYIDPAFAARIKPGLRPPEPLIRVLPGVHPTQFRIYENGYLTARAESWVIFGAEMGITYTYPLLDRRVIEFIYSVPGNLHLQHGKSRYLHRYTMARVLPQSVAWDMVKDDTALESSHGKWLTRYGEARGKRSPMAERANLPNPWVDMPRLREKLSRKGAPRELPENSGAILAAYESLKIWERWQKGSKENLNQRNP